MEKLKNIQLLAMLSYTYLPFAEYLIEGFSGTERCPDCQGGGGTCETCGGKGTVPTY